MSRLGVCSFPVELPWVRLPPALSLHVGLIVVGPLTSLLRSGPSRGWPACKDEGFALGAGLRPSGWLIVGCTIRRTVRATPR